MPQSVTYATLVVVSGDAIVHQWALDGAGPPDAGVVNELARVRLAARRFGWSVRVYDVCPDLSALLNLCGLSHLVA